MKFHVITLFPEYFRGFLTTSLVHKAILGGVIEVNLVQLRDFAANRHNRVDDKVFGGGPGMLLQVGPIDRALRSIPGGGRPALLTDPRGRRLTSAYAAELARLPELTLVCGAYEGVDYRVNERLVDGGISIGDYVLNGGETAAAAVIEAVARLLPGFMGDAGSKDEESFDASGLPEYPQYTRPEEYSGWRVPDVLLSGNHGEIKKWREAQRPRLRAEAEAARQRTEGAGPPP